MHRAGKRAAAAALMMVAGAALVANYSAMASSHSDAPLIKQDPQANLTDVYAFIGTKYNDPDTQVLNVIVNVRPFSEPGDGPHYERFADDARYSIHLTDPTSGADLIRYDFEFSSPADNYKNIDTILSYGLGTEVGAIETIGDARQNFTQTYNVLRVENEVPMSVVGGALVAPPNVGNAVTPSYNDEMGKAVSGAATFDELDAYTQQAITDAAAGVVTFAGPREDSFYADIPGVFDLLNIRILDNNGTLEDGLGQDGGGTDGFKGFNVLSFGMQIPLDQVPELDYIDTFFGPQQGVGVYASVSRRQFTTRNAGDDVQNTGPWVQVNRLGNPIMNEAFVPFKDKDRFNSVAPTGDLDFATYVENPELATLVNFVYGTEFASTGRSDLFSIYIPDVLRVATTTGPVPLSNDPDFSRFGFVGGDMTGGVSSGWPNGRRLGDDVIDIALTALASGPSYDVVTVVGDNVAGNDAAYHAVFPYAATPHSGTVNRKDPPLTDFEIADVNNDGNIDILDFVDFSEAWKAAAGL